MRKAYRILADAIAILVALQAMVMIFAIAGLFHWINDEGGSVDAAVVDSWEDDHPTFQGAIGVPIHQMVGTFLIPLVALALLVVAFFAAVDGGVKWAAIIVGSVILQVAAGITLLCAGVTTYFYLRSAKTPKPVFHDAEKVRFDGLSWMPGPQGGEWTGGLTWNFSR